MSSITYPPRQDFAEYFANLLMERIPEKASVLDIGCGPDLHSALQKIRPHFGRLTGIDLGADVFENRHLDRAIQSPFESHDFEGEVFDAAFAYNVVEHLPNPVAFAHKLSKVVKPGGWFWTLTPHANHPFARVSRFIELIGLKPMYRTFIQREDGFQRVNDYSSYYRLNNISSVERFLQPPQRVFDNAEFILMDAGWDSYFPTFLQWIPKLYDRSIARTYPKFRLLFLFGVRIA